MDAELGQLGELCDFSRRGNGSSLGVLALFGNSLAAVCPRELCDGLQGHIGAGERRESLSRDRQGRSAAKQYGAGGDAACQAGVAADSLSEHD